MNKQEKLAQVAELKEKLQKSSAVLLCNNLGIDVPTITGLRQDFRKQQCEYRVYKNTLIKLAVAGTAMEGVSQWLEGPTVVIFAWESPVNAAKIVRDFAKNNPNSFQIKGAFLEGTLLDAKGAAAVADMPGKDEIRSALLATLMAPATQLVQMLQAGAQNFVYALGAYHRKQSE